MTDAPRKFLTPAGRAKQERDEIKKPNRREREAKSAQWLRYAEHGLNPKDDPEGTEVSF